MGYYINTAFRRATEGLLAFVECFRPQPRSEAIHRESIDRYFCHVGSFLIGARNEFEREYMGGIHADV